MLKGSFIATLNGGYEKMLKREFDRRVKLLALEIGDAILELARQIVPVDTGALRDSLKVEVFKRGNSWVIRISANTHYAIYVELGTSNPNYPVQPYVTPAIIHVLNTNKNVKSFTGS